MSRNDLKKIFVYSDATMRHIIESALADLAEAERTTLSSQIEKFLLQGIFPHNKEVAYQVRMMYEDDLPICKVLSIIYDNLGNGVDNMPLHTNVLPLVRYSYELACFAHSDINVNDEKIYNFRSSLESVVDTLGREAEKKNTYAAKDAYKYSKELLKTADNDIKSLRLLNVWGIIINNWDVLYTERITYRLMSYMSALQDGLKNTAETRVKLIQILDEISNEWE